MKRKWRYTDFTTILMAALLLGMAACKDHDTEEEMLTGFEGDLEGLEQPVNQTVFSDVRTIKPERKAVNPVIQADGVIAYDPSLMNTISSRYTGRIEKLYMRYNFQMVSRGQRILDIYSPEILSAQENLLFVLRNDPGKAELIQAAENKLLWFGMSRDQISAVRSTMRPINPLPVFSPYDGHIHDIGSNAGSGSETAPSPAMGGMGPGAPSQPQQTQIENLPAQGGAELSIREGAYLESGKPVFAVYNISRVWAMVYLYQTDAAYVKTGDKVTLVSETFPDQVITGKVQYMEPVTGEKVPAIRVRIPLDNRRQSPLKIGTLLRATIEPPAINGLWLPSTAVIDLGQSRVVFLKKGDHFIATRVRTGYTGQGRIQILEGLSENDAVAENARYLVDSESFVKPVN